MIIYKTINLINNKFYIGQYIKNNPKYYGSGKLINAAIKKYGKENFKKEILEYCTDEKHMDEREIFWINELNATNRKIAYNICEGGKSHRTMKGENNYWFGKHHSEESKALIKEKRKLQKMTKDQIENQRKIFNSDKNPGKNKTKETIDKLKDSAISLNRFGENNTMFGKTHTKETKSNWSKNRKGKNTGLDNPDATRYYVESPTSEVLIFNNRKDVMEKLGCSLGFFSTKKFKKFKLIKKEKINRKQNEILDDELFKYHIEFPTGEVLTFNKKSEIIEKIGCSLYFFKSKKFKGHKIIKREII